MSPTMKRLSDASYLIEMDSIINIEDLSDFGNLDSTEDELSDDGVSQSEYIQGGKRSSDELEYSYDQSNSKILQPNSLKKSKSFRGLARDCSTVLGDRKNILIISKDFKLKLSISRIVDHLGFNFEKYDSFDYFKDKSSDIFVEVAAILFDSHLFNEYEEPVKKFFTRVNILNIPVIILADSFTDKENSLNKLVDNSNSFTTIFKPCSIENISKIFHQLNIGVEYVDWKDGSKSFVNLSNISNYSGLNKFANSLNI